MAKERLDIVLAMKGLAPSREKAKAIIMAGDVYIGTERILKPDFKVPPDTSIEIKGNSIPYVGFGGLKLEKALETFGISVEGKKAIDIGSSTGGFTDCLLQRGATSVCAVDVGTHQLHERLRRDPRVIVKENVNARYLGLHDMAYTADIITIDVSFISLKKILPVAVVLLAGGGKIISLVKPQFEVGRYQVGKGGIVKDTARIEGVLNDILAYGPIVGLKALGTIEAPREKEKKNKEYFILWET
jgi:23S rRNA (cytidine1920-2'-O)/16S rRNA (cytidine1409-2'-O)-methyltransferase